MTDSRPLKLSPGENNAKLDSFLMVLYSREPLPVNYEKQYFERLASV